MFAHTFHQVHAGHEAEDRVAAGDEGGGLLDTAPDLLGLLRAVEIGRAVSVEVWRHRHVFLAGARATGTLRVLTVVQPRPARKACLRDISVGHSGNIRAYTFARLSLQARPWLRRIAVWRRTT